MLWQIALFGPGGVDPTELNPDSALALGLKVFAVALAVIGGIAVIYVIVGGLHYIIAAGNSNEQTTAKKTITYAIIGLVLAALSFVIIGEVLRRLQFVASV